jgi:hypothetical protein
MPTTYTRRIEASLLASGLTSGSALGYKVLGVGGTTLVARTTTGITEDGVSANYFADVTGWDVSWSGSIVWDAGTGTLARESFLPYAPQTGDGFLRLGAPTGASIAADIATRSTFAGGAVASVTAPVTVNFAQTGLTPRDLGAVADAALTFGDALVAGIVGAAGKESIVGTTYTVKTPSTGTAIRAFALDSAITPTSRS